MNLLEKAISDKMSQMDESQTALFLHSVGKEKPANVALNIGQYVEGGTIVMLATLNGRKLADTSITGLLAINEYYKQTYLTPEWRQAIKDKLNRNKNEVRKALAQ